MRPGERKCVSRVEDAQAPVALARRYRANNQRARNATRIVLTVATAPLSASNISIGVSIKKSGYGMSPIKCDHAFLCQAAVSSASMPKPHRDQFAMRRYPRCRLILGFVYLIFE